MRSRFAAYALNLADYLIATTHPANRQYRHDRATWAAEIATFAQQTEFVNIEILDTQEGDLYSTVTFVAHLMQNGKDVTFTERSYFEKVKGKWLYRSGLMAQGKDPAVVPKEPLQLLPFAYLGKPVLRQVGKEIGEMTPEVAELIERMVKTMDACDCLGLAAPQVHQALKLFVIREPIEAADGSISLGDVLVFINPTLSKPSEETWVVSEGCLSIPAIYGDVTRPKEIDIDYTDIHGNRVQERVKGWKARVIMHENDHINGILFIDHLDQKLREEMEPALRELQAWLE
jgi:peptide deformylase